MAFTQHPNAQDVLTVLDVQTGHERSQQTSHSHRGHEGAVTVVGAQGQGALAQVGQPLRQANHEQVVGVLGVVHRQLPQHGCQASVVGA